MVKPKQLPSGSWRAQVYVGPELAGNKSGLISVTRDTEKECAYAALELELHYKQIAKDKSNLTVKEAMTLYISTYENTLSPATIRGYDIMSRNNMKGLWNYKLNQLTSNIIQREVDKELKTHAPKTVINMFSFLKTVLKAYRPNFKMDIKLPKEKPKLDPNLRRIKIDELLMAIKGTTIELAVLMAVWLGMRASEITALTWDMIDFENKLMYITKAVVRNKEHKFVEKDTNKTYDSTRTLQIPSYILELLIAQKEISTSERIYTLTSNAIAKRFTRILIKHNIPHIRFHDLRHLNASVMHKLRIPDKYAMERGGWATTHIMKKVYMHTFEDEREEVDNAIDEFFEYLISSRTSHDISHSN